MQRQREDKRIGVLKLLRSAWSDFPLVAAVSAGRGPSIPASRMTTATRLFRLGLSRGPGMGHGGSDVSARGERSAGGASGRTARAEAKRSAGSESRARPWTALERGTIPASTVGGEGPVPSALPVLRRRVIVVEPVEPGDVLVLDREHRSQMRLGSKAGDSAVIGVVLRDPSQGKGRALIAVSGVALCKADASFGAIQPGDSLTVSPTRGHAMHSRIHGPGAILGKALEPLDKGRGLIRVHVMLA